MVDFYLPPLRPANLAGSFVSGLEAGTTMRGQRQMQALRKDELDSRQRQRAAMQAYAQTGDVESARAIDPETWLGLKGLEDKQRMAKIGQYEKAIELTGDALPFLMANQDPKAYALFRDDMEKAMPGSGKLLPPAFGSKEEMQAGLMKIHQMRQFLKSGLTEYQRAQLELREREGLWKREKGERDIAVKERRADTDYGYKMERLRLEQEKAAKGKEHTGEEAAYQDAVKRAQNEGKPAPTREEFHKTWKQAEAEGKPAKPVDPVKAVVAQRLAGGAKGKPGMQQYQGMYDDAKSKIEAMPDGPEKISKLQELDARARKLGLFK